MQVVRGEVVVLLNRFESPFHSEPSRIHYLVCGCRSVNALSSHITPHLYGQVGVIHKLVQQYGLFPKEMVLFLLLPAFLVLCVAIASCRVSKCRR